MHMKYLLLIVVLALVFAMLARKRARPPQPKPESNPGPKVQQALNMVTCQQCGLHLPLDEALPGQGGLFCSAAHRASYELEHGTQA